MRNVTVDPAVFGICKRRHPRGFRVVLGEQGVDYESICPACFVYDTLGVDADAIAERPGFESHIVRLIDAESDDDMGLIQSLLAPFQGLPSHASRTPQEHDRR